MNIMDTISSKIFQKKKNMIASENPPENIPRNIKSQSLQILEEITMRWRGKLQMTTHFSMESHLFSNIGLNVLLSQCLIVSGITKHTLLLLVTMVIEKSISSASPDILPRNSRKMQCEVNFFLLWVHCE